MLLERTEQLGFELDTYEKAKALSSKTQDLSNRLRSAKEIHSMLIRVNVTRNFLHKNSMNVELNETFKGLRDALNGLNEFVQKDQVNILEPNVFWRTNAENLEKKSTQVFILSWKNYINERLLIKDEKELKIWGQIPELSGAARKLQEFVSNVENIKEELPSIKEIQLIETISNDMKKFMDDLDKVGIPDNVSNFLSKASTIGVSLSDMNEELIQWLEKHDMQQYCQVKLVYNG